MKLPQTWNLENLMNVILLETWIVMKKETLFLWHKLKINLLINKVDQQIKEGIWLIKMGILLIIWMVLQCSLKINSMREEKYQLHLILRNIISIHIMYEVTSILIEMVNLLLLRRNSLEPQLVLAKLKLHLINVAAKLPLEASALTNMGI